ncbi:MAG: hypothetical protein EOQ55_12555 [Mesorhizobium sp.]|uniref:hypothetical protein n=1 Tax=Mesorhizobium sp. TaxID=1871066 RepID=UPI000FE8E400|nr:hypothetical protein [Mesorhizobium sp.]RWG20121.1 MAG: hypothetical protein EOQ55_12555 [Mesorhizobium sp.]RWI96182.1 MAG: hypothetical protein EOR21_09185 [Mesorhizobium sp.]
MADKKAALDADTRLHALDQNGDLQKRLGSEISTVAGLIDQLRDKRFKIEIGEAEAVVAPKSSAAKQHRQWDIDEKVLKAGPPAYPNIVRGSHADADEVFSEALAATAAYCKAAVFNHFRKHGCHPDQLVELEHVVSHTGEMHALLRWFSGRCGALESRVKELEERSFDYKGVWKADERYKRGHFVTHSGSLWHCEVAGSGIVPGNGAAGWRLAVKRGENGKDASR